MLSAAVAAVADGCRTSVAVEIAAIGRFRGVLTALLLALSLERRGILGAFAVFAPGSDALLLDGSRRQTAALLARRRIVVGYVAAVVHATFDKLTRVSAATTERHRFALFEFSALLHTGLDLVSHTFEALGVELTRPVSTTPLAGVRSVDTAPVATLEDMEGSLPALFRPAARFVAGCEGAASQAGTAHAAMRTGSMAAVPFASLEVVLRPCGAGARIAALLDTFLEKGIGSPATFHGAADRRRRRRRAAFDTALEGLPGLLIAFFGVAALLDACFSPFTG